MYAHMQGEHFEKSPVISPARRRSETQQSRVDWAVVTPMLIGGPLAFASIVLLAWSLSYLLYL
jgi:hypothetical protein